MEKSFIRLTLKEQAEKILIVEIISVVFTIHDYTFVVY